MESKTITNKQGTLQGRDFWKGILVGGASAAVYSVIEIAIAILGEGGLSSVLEQAALLRIATAALTTFLGYLLKNLGEPTKTYTIHDTPKG
jgi:hypothetical protein